MGRKNLEWREDLLSLDLGYRKANYQLKCLIYVAKREPYLYYIDKSKYEHYRLMSDYELLLSESLTENVSFTKLNGKVVASFILNKAEDIIMRKICGEWEVYGSENGQDSLIQKSCLTQKEIFRYFKGNNGYAWKIDDLKIFDRPKELGEFYKVGYRDSMKFWEYEKAKGCIAPCPESTYKLTKAPQKMVWVDDYD